MHMCVLVADGRDIDVALDRFMKYDYVPSKPEARWDWITIGGYYKSALPLKQPRQLRRFFGLLPAGQTSRVSVAKKSEIDQQAYLADPPAALFFRDQLFVCPLSADADELANWD